MLLLLSFNCFVFFFIIFISYFGHPVYYRYIKKIFFHQFCLLYYFPPSFSNGHAPNPVPYSLPRHLCNPQTTITFELTYNAPDGSVGLWQKGGFEKLRSNELRRGLSAEEQQELSKGGGFENAVMEMEREGDTMSFTSQSPRSLKGSMLSLVSTKSSKSTKSTRSSKRYCQLFYTPASFNTRNTFLKQTGFKLKIGQFLLPEKKLN